ncbi:MAG: sigma-70 family RNA polymerase sigma factor [Cyclobacteriaceae bacterium]
MKISEPALIELLKNGDEKGFEYLYESYSAALYGIVFRIVKTEEVANEVLQDAFLKIYNNINSYDSKKGKLFTWMLNLTRNLSIDKTRSKEMSQARQSDNVGDNVYMLDHESTDIKVDDIGVKELLNKLDKDQQDVVELVYFGGYTQSEAAKELSLPLGTVKTRIRASLKLLRKVLSVN